MDLNIWFLKLIKTYESERPEIAIEAYFLYIQEYD